MKISLNMEWPSDLIFEKHGSYITINPWNILLILFYLVVLGTIIHACGGLV